VQSLLQRLLEDSVVLGNLEMVVVVAPSLLVLLVLVACTLVGVVA
jgi:hypothetical protein